MIAFALALAPGMATASGHDRARDAVRTGEALPLGQIVGIVSGVYPGRLLDANLVQSGGGLIYQLRWLTNDGRMINVTVDADSGRILGVRGR